MTHKQENDTIFYGLVFSVNGFVSKYVNLL